MIYFDNAATTLCKPPGVAEAVSAAVGSLGNAGRGAHGVSLDAARMIYGVREKLCRLFNAEDPTRIAFTSGGTESLNIAIKGIAGPGDHLITTAAEHNSVLRPAYEMQTAGAELTVIPCDDLGRVDPQEIESNMRANTKAVICTHGSNVTGNIPDMEKIGAITSQRMHGRRSEIVDRRPVLYRAQGIVRTAGDGRYLRAGRRGAETAQDRRERSA